MSGRSSQAKGRRAEAELAEYLRDHGFPDARPGDPLNLGADGLHIECKRHERLEISRWYEQAQQDAQRMKDGKPVVVYRQNRRSWMVVLSLADFLALAGKEKEHGDISD